MVQDWKFAKTRRFRPLFFTQFFGAFTDNAFKSATLIWITFEKYPGEENLAGMSVSLAAGVFILPFFLFSASSGRLVDAVDKAKLTVRLKQIECVLMGLTGIAFYWENVSLLIAILFATGTQSTIFGPIKYALLPEHLKKGELIAGNGLIEAGTFLAILLGTVYGGLVIRAESGILVLCVSLVFVSALGWAASRKIPPTVRYRALSSVDWNPLKSTSAVLRDARERRHTWDLMIAISWFWFIGASFLTLFPVYSAVVIGGDEGVVTLFLAVFSVGIGVGALGCNRLNRGEIKLTYVPVGLIGIAVSVLAFFFCSWLYPIAVGAEPVQVLEFLTTGLASWGILISLLALAVFAGIYTVPLYTALQSCGMPSDISGLIAANNIVNSVFIVGSAVIANLLFWLGAGPALILLISGVAGLLFLPQVLRLVTVNDFCA